LKRVSPLHSKIKRADAFLWRNGFSESWFYEKPVREEMGSCVSSKGPAGLAQMQMNVWMAYGVAVRMASLSVIPTALLLCDPGTLNLLNLFACL
jgi:hypothetical protein